MKIFNKYFLRQFTVFFIAFLAILVGLAWMMQILTMLRFLVQYGINIWEFLGMTAMIIPLIATTIAPFVLFIACTFVINRTISDNEVTVMAASGMSPGQLAKPAVIFAGAIAAIHLILSIWVVPATQGQFYDRQWEMRYGLAHLKLQESSFTQMSPGLVVYVDQVRDHDMTNIMMDDRRNPDNQMTVLAKQGKLINTVRGLSVAMSGGSLQFKGDGSFAVGTFDTFELDMNLTDRGGGGRTRAQRIKTTNLIRGLANKDNYSESDYQIMVGEAATRFLSPFMDIILVLAGAAFLFKMSLLRRRISLSAAFATGSMIALMSAFMMATKTVASVAGIMWIFGAEILAIAILALILFTNIRIKK